MSEFLQRMLGELAIAKTLPDADLQFLIGLETMILQKLREPVDAMAGQLSGGQGGGPVGPGGGPGGGAGADVGAAMPSSPMGAMGMGPAQPMPAPAAAGIGVPGVAQGPGQIPPDELRRMLGQ